jgi:hypothetical protein
MRTLRQLISTGLFGLLLLGGTEARSAEAKSDVPPSVPETRVPPLVPNDSGTANRGQATKPEPSERNPKG